MSKCTTEVFTRCTGFFRPVQEFNPGKTSEVNDRKKFDISKEELLKSKKK